MSAVSYPEPRGSQIQVVEALLAPLAVTACAGSGKTLTAVHRLAKLSRMLEDDRTRVALLSFSNVAVATFERDYRHLAVVTGSHRRVEITTLDSFLTTNILKPHGHRTMGYGGVPYLVAGGEPFLSGFNVRTPTFPVNVASVSCERIGQQWRFFHQSLGEKVVLEAAHVVGIVRRLGAVGAYTHNFGRYWAYETLVSQPAVLRSLANRYKHILIDEAQDLGTAHQGLLQLLIDSGVQVSLIGDPNQGIFEFAGADGEFLRGFSNSHGASPFDLTENFRSVPLILEVANRLSGRRDTPARETPETPNGAFYTGYRPNTECALVARFIHAVTSAGLRLENSAVLCRGSALCEKLKGEITAPGEGIVAIFAQAAFRRDAFRDYSGAFALVINGISKLLKGPPGDFSVRVSSSESTPGYRLARQLLWAFVTKPETGLPRIQRLGRTEWHPELLAGVGRILETVAEASGLTVAENVRRKLAARRLPPGALFAGGGNGGLPVRIDTVHQAKGESLDAVLYIAGRGHAEAMLEGVRTEVGRIGYVALTRARDLFWLGVPNVALVGLQNGLGLAGFSPLED